MPDLMSRSQWLGGGEVSAKSRPGSHRTAHRPYDAPPQTDAPAASPHGRGLLGEWQVGVSHEAGGLTSFSGVRKLSMNCSKDSVGRAGVQGALRVAGLSRSND